jgi:hypothetical protein
VQSLFLPRAILSFPPGFCLAGGKGALQISTRFAQHVSTPTSTVIKLHICVVCWILGVEEWRDSRLRGNTSQLSSFSANELEGDALNAVYSNIKSNKILGCWEELVLCFHPALDVSWV